MKIVYLVYEIPRFGGNVRVVAALSHQADALKLAENLRKERGWWGTARVGSINLYESLPSIEDNPKRGWLK
jgi:hypothetical protein